MSLEDLEITDVKVKVLERSLHKTVDAEVAGSFEVELNLSMS